MSLEASLYFDRYFYIIIYPLSRPLFTCMLKIEPISVHKPVSHTTNINMTIRSYASKLIVNVCINLLLARYVYMFPWTK